MAVSDHLKPGLTDRSRVRIMTVDTANRRVEAGLKDGSMIQVAVWDVPNAFRWPIEGEIWIVRRDNGIWVLDRRQQVAADENAFPITQMNPGEMKLDSNIVIDASGRTFVAVDLTGIENGWTLTWDATLMRFVAGP